MNCRRRHELTWLPTIVTTSLSERVYATAIDAASIAKLNASIRGYNHDEGTVQSVLGENGLPSDSGIRDAVTLNRIDDWKCFHEAVLK